MSSFSWVSPAVKISLASQFLYVLGMCLPPGIKQTACAGICIERSSWCTINAYLTWCVCQVTKVGFPGAITTSSVFLHVCPSLSLYIYIIFFFIPQPDFSISLLCSRQSKLVSYSHSLLLTRSCFSALTCDIHLAYLSPPCLLISYILSQAKFFCYYYLRTSIPGTYLPNDKLEDWGHYTCLFVSPKAEKTWIREWWGTYLGVNILGEHSTEFFSMSRKLFLDRFNVSPWRP